MSLDLPFFPWITPTQVSSKHVPQLTEQQLEYLRSAEFAQLYQRTTEEGREAHERRLRNLRGGRIPDDKIYDSSSKIHLQRYQKIA